MFATPSTRWTALQTRNPLAADAFIYCVKSTKIYCRPTCPSRLARRANVIFQNTYIEAAAAGYRPCKRCRPNYQGDEADSQKLAVKKACEIIQKEPIGEKRRSVKELAKEVGLTESHFCRIFKKIAGRTVGEYRRSLEVGIVHSLGELSGLDQENSTTDSTFSSGLDDFQLHDESLTKLQCWQVFEQDLGAEDIDFSLFDENWWVGR